MTNRVTDQTTQNGLISKFQLKGLMPEMMVESRIVPVVQVASLEDSLNISEFEKWRSVFSSSVAMIDPSDITTFTPAFATGVNNIAATPAAVGPVTTQNSQGSFGCALPGGAVGVPATDGIYRVTVHGTTITSALQAGNVEIRDQAAFGAGVALGTLRSTIGTFIISNSNSTGNPVLDYFLLIRTTDIANALVLTSTSGIAAGMGVSIYVQKLINEIPPNVIFP